MAPTEGWLPGLNGGRAAAAVPPYPSNQTNTSTQEAKLSLG